MKDQIRIGPELNDGRRVVIRRREGQDDELAAISKMKDGETLSEGAELIHIKGDGEWKTVNVLYRHGPAQVATPSYRAGYDRIFGRKQPTGEA